MSLLLFSLFSVVAQAGISGTWPKDPKDSQSKCFADIHWCAEDHYPSKYYDLRPTCPKGSYEWLKITAYRPGEGGGDSALCEGELKEGFDLYPFPRTLSFACNPDEFERRPDGDYVEVFVGYRLKHYPRPSKFSKLTERWDCVPAVGAGSLDDLFR